MNITRIALSSVSLTLSLLSNPYHNTARPGIAQVSRVSKPPVSGSLDPNKIAELAPEYHPIRDCLLGLVEALKQAQMNAVDKRQLGEAEKGVAVLLKRLARVDISPDVSEKVLNLAAYVSNQDFRNAQSIQTGLVNSDWREHKDWLKGIKALLQLAGKFYY